MGETYYVLAQTEAMHVLRVLVVFLAAFAMMYLYIAIINRHGLGVAGSLLVIVCLGVVAIIVPKNTEIKALANHAALRAELQSSIDAGNVDNALLFDCAAENEWLMIAKKQRQRRMNNGEKVAYMDVLVGAMPIIYQGAVVTYDTVPAKSIAVASPAQ